MNVRALSVSMACAACLSGATSSVADTPLERLQKAQQVLEAASKASRPEPVVVPQIPQRTYVQPQTPVTVPNTVNRNYVPQQSYTPRTASVPSTSYTPHTTSVPSTSYVPNSTATPSTSYTPRAASITPSTSYTPHSTGANPTTSYTPHASSSIGSTSTYTPHASTSASTATTYTPHAVTSSSGSTYTPHASVSAGAAPAAVTAAFAGNGATTYTPHAAATPASTTTYAPQAASRASAVSAATSASTSNAATYTPHANASTTFTPKSSVTAAVIVPGANPAFVQTDDGSLAAAPAGDSQSCDGYPLQTIGSGTAGTVCRCVYGGPSNTVGWWAVTPGGGSNSMASCGPPTSRSSLASAVSATTSAVQTTTTAPSTTPLQTTPSTQVQQASNDYSSIHSRHEIPAVDRCFKMEETPYNDALEHSIRYTVVNRCDKPVAMAFCWVGHNACDGEGAGQVCENAASRPVDEFGGEIPAGGKREICLGDVRKRASKILFRACPAGPHYEQSTFEVRNGVVTQECYELGQPTPTMK